MRTEIIMTPEELENIKNELINKVIKGIFTKKMTLEIEDDYFNKGRYKITGEIYIDNKYNTIEIDNIYLDFDELPPSIKEIIKDESFSTYNRYNVTDIKLERDI